MAQKIYIVARTVCGSRLVEPIGAALDETAAVALCELPEDCIAEVDAGKRYTPGEISPDIRYRNPLSSCKSGWMIGGTVDATR